MEQFPGLVAPTGMVLLSEASLCPAQKRCCPLQIPPRTSAPRAPFSPLCLIVPRKAWGLASLHSLWLQPLLEMGSKQQD